MQKKNKQTNNWTVLIHDNSLYRYKSISTSTTESASFNSADSIRDPLTSSTNSNVQPPTIMTSKYFNDYIAPCIYGGPTTNKSTGREDQRRRRRQFEDFSFDCPLHILQPAKTANDENLLDPQK